jgi:deoxyadenosine/deoxycytidine kinase
MNKIVIGGFIASGKSTVIRGLAKNGYKTIDEFSETDDMFLQVLSWFYEGREGSEMMLQNYFITKSFDEQIKIKNSKQRFKDDIYICDRDIFEHYIFAMTNLPTKTQKVIYSNLFHQYFIELDRPSKYIFLDIDFKTFKERIFKRNRRDEVHSFDKNETYFKVLLSTYKQKLESLCKIWDIPFYVINAQHNQLVVDYKVKQVIFDE